MDNGYGSLFAIYRSNKINTMIKTTSQDKEALKVAKATHKERLKSFPDTMKKHRYELAKLMLSKPAPKFGRLTLNLVGYNKLTWG